MSTGASLRGIVPQCWREGVAGLAVAGLLFVIELKCEVSAGRMSAVTGGLGVVLLTIPALYIDYYARKLAQLKNMDDSKVVNMDQLLGLVTQMTTDRMTKWSWKHAWALRIGLMLSASSYVFAFRAAT